MWGGSGNFHRVFAGWILSDYFSILYNPAARQVFFVSSRHAVWISLPATSRLSPQSFRFLVLFGVEIGFLASYQVLDSNGFKYDSNLGSKNWKTWFESGFETPFTPAFQVSSLLKSGSDTLQEASYHGVSRVEVEQKGSLDVRTTHHVKVFKSKKF